MILEQCVYTMQFAHDQAIIENDKEVFTYINYGMSIKSWA